MRWALALLAIGLAVCLLTRPTGPVSDPSRNAHIDSATAVHRADSAALASADTALARDARDSSVRVLTDSADALGKRLDSLDRLAARWRRVARLRGDSLRDVRREPGAEVPDTLAFDSATVELPADSSLSCESRYAGRLQQLALYGEALERCRIRGDTLRATLIGVRDSFKVSAHYLQASDSLLRWERDRPRPCRVSLGITSVGCGTAMTGTAVLTSLLWVIVGH